MEAFMGEVANVFLLWGLRILVERMRRTLGDCICKHKACESADHSMGLLMVLVRVFYLWGEERVGTKQGMENGFVWEFSHLWSIGGVIQLVKLPAFSQFHWGRPAAVYMCKWKCLENGEWSESLSYYVGEEASSAKCGRMLAQEFFIPVIWKTFGLIIFGQQ